jgi:hypothetical protein
VGNHDISNGNKYEEFYGKSFFSFRKSSEIFIILNTELNDGKIKGEQLDTLIACLKVAEDNPGIKNVFIFSHRPVWAENNDKYKGLFEGNTRSGIGSSNFEPEIRPLLIKVKKPVFWMSGSTAGGPSSFFYDKEAGTMITFIQSAIRDLPRDALLLIDLKKGQLTMQGISLTGNELEPIENYGIDFWLKAKGPEKKFSYRLIPYLTIKMLKHEYFWIGFLFSSLFSFIVFLFLRKWKRKK